MATEELPSSSRRASVELKDCIEDLLRFTLLSYVSLDEAQYSSNRNINTSIGLSKDYCLQLLHEDPSNPFQIDATSSTEGVPPYPLYKCLATSLLHTISSGAWLKLHNKASLFHEDSSWKHKEDELKSIIVVEGSKLRDMLKTVDFQLHVQEPFFSQLRDGVKTVEGRCAVGDYNKIDAGAIILFNKSLMLQVQEIRRYDLFSSMLEAEGLMKVLPGVKNIEEGVQVYRNFYSEEKERSNGVLAICLEKPSYQLCNVMFTILSGLRYEGVQRLLGFAHSIGTIPDALPPPTSMLISSFSSLHRSNVLS